MIHLQQVIVITAIFIDLNGTLCLLNLHINPPVTMNDEMCSKVKNRRESRKRLQTRINT